MALPPGPRLPRLVQAWLVFASPYGWMQRRMHRYGDCFSSRFPFYGRVVYLAEPSLIKELFTGDSQTFHSGEATAQILGPVLGTHSLLTLDEDEHMRQRKLLLPPFHGEAIRRYEQRIVDITQREVDRWPVGEPIELRPRMQAITLDVILRAVFGVREDERMELYRQRITGLAERGTILIFSDALRRDLGRFSPGGRFQRALRDVNTLIYEEIAERRAAPDAEQRDDVLSLLLAARHEDGSPMSDQELRDELMTLVTAGHETTATGLSWAFERLMRTPDAMGRLLDSLDSDEYVDATVKETLRVRPVITDIARKLTRDAEVAGHRIPAGTLVLAAISAVHARPDSYPEPERFRPERWLDGGVDSYGWVPFGGGVRRCIGASFAQMEMRLVLRTVLSRVRLRAPSPRPERPRIRHVTVVPARGARALVEARLAVGADDHEQLGARGDGGVVAADTSH